MIVGASVDVVVLSLETDHLFVDEDILRNIVVLVFYIHWVDKGNEVSTLSDAGIKVLHILLLLSGLQEFIEGFGLIGGGVGIHNTHIANTFLLLRTEVSNDCENNTGLCGAYESILLVHKSILLLFHRTWDMARCKFVQWKFYNWILNLNWKLESLT